MPFKYEHVPGFFHSDAVSPALSSDEALKQSFGLVDTTPGRWESFKTKLSQLNAEGEADGASYKVLWFARHGESWLNVASTKFIAEGTWHSKWIDELTDGTLTWGPDTALTDFGASQAKAAGRAWAVAAQDGVPLPTRWITSPLQKACQTCVLTWGDEIWRGLLHKGANGEGVNVQVVEDVREKAWAHICDERRPKSFAQAQFPGLQWPADMPEQDKLFNPDENESDRSVEARVVSFLDDVWSRDDTSVSLTGHKDLINAFWTVIGHPLCSLDLGQVVPQVVRRVEV